MAKKQTDADALLDSLIARKRGGGRGFFSRPEVRPWVRAFIDRKLQDSRLTFDDGIEMIRAMAETNGINPDLVPTAGALSAHVREHYKADCQRLDGRADA